MLQQKPTSKKKIIASFVIVALMLGGMAWMLIGPSSPSADSFIPIENGTAASVPTNARLDSNLFQNPMFARLAQRDTLSPLDPSRIGRANPFVPVGTNVVETDKEQ